ncbi:MAG: HAD family hydrolase [Anaerolineae bacterium]
MAGKGQIKAALFDWDLTLSRVLGEASPYERLSALFRSIGLDYTPHEILAAIAEVRAQQAAEGGPANGERPQTQRSITRFYRQILKLLGPEPELEQLNRLYDAYALLPVVLFEDALETLRHLHERGIRLGIISNHSRAIRGVIARYLGAYIPPRHIVISQEERVYKPAKTIFRRAATRMGVPAEQCLYVGDTLSVDAVGAVQQGSYGLGLWLDRGEEEPTPPLPSRVHRITSLEQVLDFVNGEHLSA